MISFVRGPLAAVEEDSVVVEAGGVGLEIRVPLSVLEQLPSLGEEVKMYTYFQVREDTPCSRPYTTFSSSRRR